MATMDMVSMTVLDLKSQRKELSSLLTALKEDGIADDVKNTKTQAVLKIFEKIIGIRVNADMIEKSKINEVLLQFKSSFDKESSLGQETKKLLGKWKQDLREEEEAKALVADTTKAKKDEKRKAKEDVEEAATSKKLKIEKVVEKETPENEPVTPGTGGVGALGFSDVESLPAGRKKIYDKFLEVMKIDVDSSIDDNQISFYAEDIERSLDAFLPFAANSNTYVQKAMTLIFNLKQNGDLRKDLLEGVIPPPDFVKMSAKDLAPAHLAKERQERTEMLLKSKRTDIYDLARQEIQMQNGLSQETEFQCRKCKSVRTTHYALQTRSSDEPMTIFVCCLNCKFRWRC